MLKSNQIPEKYRCAITGQIMIDPVFTADGHTYEREAIEEWLQRHDTSPKTNEKLEDKKLRINHDKRSDILEFLDSYPELYDGKEIYLPKSWVTQCIIAIKSNQPQEVERWLAKDRRLLTSELENDSTALHLACEFGSPELVETLLKILSQKNESITMMPETGRFKPVHLNVLLERALIKKGNYSKCELLLKLGAEVEQPETSTQNTLLHRMIINGNQEAVNWLLEQKAVLESRNSEGNTPLLLSVIHSKRKITEFLLKKNANPRAENAQQKTSFYIAVEKSDIEAEKLLLADDPNPVVGYGGAQLNALYIPAFRIAVQAGHTNVVSLLLEGVSHEIKNKQEKKPIETAAVKNSAQPTTRASQPVVNLSPSLINNPQAAFIKPPEQKNPPQKSSQVKANNLKKNMSLIEAIENNNSKEVIRLLNLKTALVKKLVDEIDLEYEASALYWAVNYGYIHFINPLVKAGADVNKRDKNGATPISLAAAHGHTEAIIALKAAGANVDTPNDEGWTPLYAAARNGHAEAIVTLKAIGANVNTPAQGITPIFISAAMGHARAITALKAVGVNVNTTNNTGWAPIHIAAQSGHAEAIAALKAAGAAIDTRIPNGATPIIIAAQSGHAAAITALKAAGAAMDTRMPNGETPIYIAAQNGHAAAITALKAAGAAMDTPSYGAPPVWIAAQNGHAEAIVALKVAGANVDMSDNHGVPPIYIAALRGHVAAVKALLEAGANASVKTNLGTALESARLGKKAGHKEVVRLLEAHFKQYPNGIKPVSVMKEENSLSAKPSNPSEQPLPQSPFQDSVNSLKATSLIEIIKENNQEAFFRLLNLKTDPFGKSVVDEVDTDCSGSPLYWAAAHGYMHFINPLIKAGTGVNKRSKNGATPVFVAAENGHAEIITVLNAAGADVDMPNYDGTTSIFIAAKKGHAAAITALITAGANVDTPKTDGATPILIAAYNGHAEAMTVLLEAGADASTRTGWGTALEVARKGKKSGHSKVVRLLETHFTQYPNGIKSIMQERFKVQFSDMKTQIELLQSVVPQEPTSSNPKQLIFTSPALPSISFHLPASASSVNQKEVEGFLRLVAEGEQDKAEAMLQQDPALALATGDVRDLSERTFTGITGFQYAVWALDWHMWTMIRKHLPDGAAREQAQGFETGSWVKTHDVHANLNILIKAYQTTIKLFEQEKWEEGNSAWVKQIGGVQRLLPAHVINEYCHPTRPFYPRPNFKDAIALPRSRIIDEADWFNPSLDGGMLGDKFAIYRGNESGGRQARWQGWTWVECCIDYEGTGVLINARTSQREELISELRSKHVQRNANSKDVAEFLTLVAEGEQDKAEAMLQKDPTLALVPGDVTDLSKRTFKDITGFQYAVWALDWHMWTMIRKYLPIEDAKLQAQEFETGSWIKSYGVNAEGLLDNLIQTYQTSISFHKASKRTEYHQALRQIGEAQFLLPVHVVNEYCHPVRSFYPIPNFEHALNFPRSRATDKGDWFTFLHNGGKENYEVICRSIRAMATVGNRIVFVPWSGNQQCEASETDHESIRALTRARGAQREELIRELRPKNVQKFVA